MLMQDWVLHAWGVVRWDDCGPEVDAVGWWSVIVIKVINEPVMSDANELSDAG